MYWTQPYCIWIGTPTRLTTSYDHWSTNEKYAVIFIGQTCVESAPTSMSPLQLLFCLNYICQCISSTIQRFPQAYLCYENIAVRHTFWSQNIDPTTNRLCRCRCASSPWALYQYRRRLMLTGSRLGFKRLTRHNIFVIYKYFRRRWITELAH